VFSVVDATVLRALTIPDRDRVVWLWSTFDRYAAEEFQLSAAEFTDLRSDVRSFSRAGAWFSNNVLLEPRDGVAARTIDVAFTSGDIYAIVGAGVSSGRLPDANDDRQGAPQVALISDAIWRESFGANPDVAGKHTLRIGAADVPIVGVLTRDSRLPATEASVWVHTVLDPASWAANRSGHGLTAVAALAPGATVESAGAELAALHHEWAARYAGQHTFGLDGHSVRLASIEDRLLGTARRTGLLLLAAAALLLALACANVANLIMARGESRASELGVRIALGASARRVAQPVLIEGLALGIAGGLLGVGLATAGLPMLLQLAPAAIALSTPAAIDLRVLAFAAGVSLTTGILFATVPAWTAMRQAPTDLLRVSSRGGTGASRGLRTLVAGQLALATCLLVGAMLLTGSLQRLNGIDPGFSSSSRVTVDLTLPQQRYRDPAVIAGFYDRVREQIGSLSSVHGVGAIRTLPLRDAQRRENLLKEGTTRPEDGVGVAVQAASIGALQAIGVPLVEGRDFQADDRLQSIKVALVNRTAARTLWPGESPLGKRFRARFLPDRYGLITVVGVYGDVHSAGLAATPAPEILLPIAQADGWTGWARNLTVVVHTGEAGPSVGDIRAAVHAVDPTVAVESPSTMTQVLHQSTARERFLAVLLAVFSALALGIAAVGVFGVVSFSVARQSRDFAIRNALGAGRGGILRSVLLNTGGTAAVGALVGAVAAGLLTPAISGFLFGVTPRSVVVLASAPLLLIVVALLAALPPALRATRVPLVRVLQDVEGAAPLTVKWSSETSKAGPRIAGRRSKNTYRHPLSSLVISVIVARKPRRSKSCRARVLPAAVQSTTRGTPRSRIQSNAAAINASPAPLPRAASSTRMSCTKPASSRNSFQLRGSIPAYK
jgi:predicted permease